MTAKWPDRSGALNRKILLARGLPPRQKRPNPRTSGQWRRAVADVKARSGGRCEARAIPECRTAGQHRHHIWLRSRGGPDEAWNLLNVCFACHDWIHAHPREATEGGFMRSEWDGNLGR